MAWRTPFIHDTAPMTSAAPIIRVTIPTMDSFSRRQFIAASTLLTARAYADVRGANDRLRIGVIGCGGMAHGHIRGLLKMKETDNVEIIAVCDVYDKRLQDTAQLTSGKPYKDYRA